MAWENLAEDLAEEFEAAQDSPLKYTNALLDLGAGGAYTILSASPDISTSGKRLSTREWKPGTKSTSHLKMVICEWCKQTVTFMGRKNRAKFCSPKCKTARARARRKHAENQERERRASQSCPDGPGDSSSGRAGSRPDEKCGPTVESAPSASRVGEAVQQAEPVDL